MHMRDRRKLVISYARHNYVMIHEQVKYMRLAIPLRIQLNRVPNFALLQFRCPPYRLICLTILLIALAAARPQHNLQHIAVLENAAWEQTLPQQLQNPFYKTPRVREALARSSWFGPGEQVVSLSLILPYRISYLFIICFLRFLNARRKRYRAWKSIMCSLTQVSYHVANISKHLSIYILLHFT